MNEAEMMVCIQVYDLFDYCSTIKRFWGVNLRQNESAGMSMIWASIELNGRMNETVLQAKVVEFYDRQQILKLSANSHKMWLSNY